MVVTQVTGRGPPGAVPRSQVARSSRHLSWIEVWWVGASQGVRKRASSRAGAWRRLLIAINKGGSRVTFGESPVRSTRRQPRARGADHPQRNGMRRTSRAGDGTRPRICQSFSSACSGPESLAPAALAALRRLARLPSARPSRDRASTARAQSLPPRGQSAEARRSRS
jgi:hypothetical protein